MGGIIGTLMAEARSDAYHGVLAMNALATWVASKPGPFSGRTHDAVWDMAWRNFNEGPTGGVTQELQFMIRLGQAGYGVRALAVGGYALDKVT